MRTPEHLKKPNAVRAGLGGPHRRRDPPPATERVVLLEREISIWGWPSRGGLIVLERAGPVDFDYLGLDRFELATHRPSQGQDEDEDAFCQKLLQLGARWYDSRARYGFVYNVAMDFEAEQEAIESGEQPAPSDAERRWVSVGIEGDGGGFWVLEYDRVMYFATENDNLVPSSASQVTLAKTMEERCEMLKRMGAKLYRHLGDYKGLASINDWQTKVEGEFGPLVKTRLLS